MERGSCIRWWAALSLLAAAAAASPRPLQDSLYPPPAAESASADHWRRLAELDLRRAESLRRREAASSGPAARVARNLVIFIGDGMGVPTVTAGRILTGQLAGQSGEERTLAFEQFDHVGLVKTYSVDHQTADSAATATAILSGVKANSGTLGVNHLAQPDNCTGYRPDEHDVASLLSLAATGGPGGRRVGLVTTTRVTHATPAAAFSHSVSRKWEDDTDRDRGGGGVLCLDIAQQLLTGALNFSVVFGGGRAKFKPKAANGTRSDGRNLVDEWRSAQRSRGRRFAYLETREDLLAMDTAGVDFVLGLFADSHLEFEAMSGDALSDRRRQQPSLAQMTAQAIRLLGRGPRGFVLLVEGGNIDNGHHGNFAHKALRELVGLNDAVAAALKLVSLDDTLVAVTADHSHVFSLGGFGARGNPLFGKNLDTYLPRRNRLGHALAEDGKPFLPLYYADGASAVSFPGGRADVTDVDTAAADYRIESLVKMKVESHGGEDVPVYASGPGSHLFHSTHEQSYLAHAFMHSGCIGLYAERIGCSAASRPKRLDWLALMVAIVTTALLRMSSN